MDGLPIYSNVFAVSHVDPTLDIPLLAGVAFGYQLRVPTPPSDERLQINHVVVWPERLEDGSTKTSTYSYEHIYLKREGNPRYWFHHFEKKPSDRYQGNWSIRLGNRGTVLLIQNLRPGYARRISRWLAVSRPSRRSQNLC